MLQKHWVVFLFLLPCSYMVDAADREKIEASRNELHNLLDKPQLQGIPVRYLIFSQKHLNLYLLFFFKHHWWLNS